MSGAITSAFQSLSAEQQMALLHTKHRKSQVVDDVKTKEEIELENERRRKKEEEKRIREEEKKKREEEKRAREEERRKREDERRRREEEKKRKEQASHQDAVKVVIANMNTLYSSLSYGSHLYSPRHLKTNCTPTPHLVCFNYQLIQLF